MVHRDPSWFKVRFHSFACSRRYIHAEVSESHSQVSDVVFWILDASDAASWASSAQKLSMSLSSGTLRPKEKLLVLVNKMLVCVMIYPTIGAYSLPDNSQGLGRLVSARI